MCTSSGLSIRVMGVHFVEDLYVSNGKRNTSLGLVLRVMGSGIFGLLHVKIGQEVVHFDGALGLCNGKWQLCLVVYENRLGGWLL